MKVKMKLNNPHADWKIWSRLQKLEANCCKGIYCEKLHMHVDVILHVHVDVILHRVITLWGHNKIVLTRPQNDRLTSTCTCHAHH